VTFFVKKSEDLGEGKKGEEGQNGKEKWKKGKIVGNVRKIRELR
jgi:hypothetical protein